MDHVQLVSSVGKDVIKSIHPFDAWFFEFTASLATEISLFLRHWRAVHLSALWLDFRTFQEIRGFGRHKLRNSWQPHFLIRWRIPGVWALRPSDSIGWRDTDLLVDSRQSEMLELKLDILVEVLESVDWLLGLLLLQFRGNLEDTLFFLC